MNTQKQCVLLPSPPKPSTTLVVLSKSRYKLESTRHFLQGKEPFPILVSILSPQQPGSLTQWGRAASSAPKHFNSPNVPLQFLARDPSTPFHDKPLEYCTIAPCWIIRHVVKATNHLGAFKHHFPLALLQSQLVFPPCVNSMSVHPFATVQQLWTCLLGCYLNQGMSQYYLAGRVHNVCSQGVQWKLFLLKQCGEEKAPGRP